MKPFEDPGTQPADIPPLPWRLVGTGRVGVFTLARPLDPPGGVQALAPRKLILFVNRYRGGDVSYEVLGTASLARRKGRIALVLHHVWVDEPAVRRVGREAYTPSDPAVFTWEESGTQVSSGGASAALSWRDRARLALPVPMTFTYFVWDGDRLGHVPAPGRATASPITMRLDKWPDHFPELTGYDASFAVRLNFTLIVSPPRMISPP